MKATLEPNGSLTLQDANETRVVQVTHTAYPALMKLYTQAANVALSAADSAAEFVRPAVIAEPTPQRGTRAESGYVPPPGCGGFPWRDGTAEDGKLYDVPIEELHADPARFQFRASTDNPLAGQEFDSCLAGSFAVWKDGGLTYVVDGHRRFQLAKGADVPTLPCRYLVDAKSADEARSVGALLNIASGSATALDAAKFLHGTGRSIADLDSANLDDQMTTDTAALLDLLKATSEKRNVAKARTVAIESVVAARERGAAAHRSGQPGEPGTRGAGGGGGRRLALTDLPPGWSIKPAGNELGLFREGRDTPVASAATVDDLTRCIAGAGRRGFLPVALSAAHTTGPVHLRLACGDERGIEIMRDSKVAMFLPILAGSNLSLLRQSAIRLERFTIALHTDNGHGTSRECRVG